MGLTESVTAGNQRDGFFVIHRHRPKVSRMIRAKATGSGCRRGLPGSHRSSPSAPVALSGFLVMPLVERVRRLAGAQPCLLGAPVHLLIGLPGVFASTGKAKV